jgi:hypothetical protein
MLLMHSLASASQIVCPDARGVWPPPGSVLPTNALFGFELDERELYTVDPGALALEVAGERIELSVTEQYQAGERVWFVLRPERPLPARSEVALIGAPSRGRERLAWTTAEGPDTDAPAIRGAPHVAQRVRSDRTVINSNSSADGLRFHEVRLWVLADAQDDSPWLALVRGEVQRSPYPVPVEAGLLPIGADQCEALHVPPSRSAGYQLQLVDAAGNAGQTLTVASLLPDPPRVGVTARRLAAEPGVAAVSEGPLEICWTSEANKVRIEAGPEPIELPANVGCWVGWPDAQGPIPVELEGVRRAVSASPGLDLGPWRGEPDPKRPWAVEAPDGELWVLSDGELWRGQDWVGSGFQQLAFAPDGGRFAVRHCQLQWTAPDAAALAWSQPVPCEMGRLAVDREGVAWRSVPTGLLGTGRDGQPRLLAGDPLRSPLIGPDGALYGTDPQGVVRVDLQTGARERWLGQRVRSMVAAHDGLYVQTSDGAVSAVGPDGLRPVAETIRSMAADRLGTLWTSDGERLGPIGSEGFSASSLGCTRIHELMEGQGGIWASCGARLLSVAPDGEVRARWQRPDRFGGSGARLVEADGSVWFSTQAGAARVRDGRVERVWLGESAWKMVRSGETLWAMTLNGGLAQLTGEPPQVRRLLPSSWGQGWGLLLDGEDLWVQGTYAAVRLDRDGVEQARARGSFQALVAEADGLWGLAEGRLDKLDRQTGQVLLSVATPQGLVARRLERDAAGRLWVHGPDLAVWDQQQWRLPEGLPDEGVSAVEPQDDGSVLVQAQGLWRVDPSGTRASLEPASRPLRSGAHALGPGASLFSEEGAPLRSTDGRLEPSAFRVWAAPAGGRIHAAEDRVWTYGAGAVSARASSTGAWQHWDAVGTQGRDRDDQLEPPSAAFDGGTAWFVRPRTWLLRLASDGERTELAVPGSPLAVARDRRSLWLLVEQPAGRALYEQPLAGGPWERVADVDAQVSALVAGPSGVWGVRAAPTRPGEIFRPEALLLAAERGQGRQVPSPVASLALPELLEGADGSLWFAGVGAGRIDEEGEVSRFERIGPVWLGEGTRVAADGDVVWIAGAGSVGRVEGDSVIPIASDLGEITGLSVRDEVAWVATRDGLLRLGPDGQRDRLDPDAFARPGAALGPGPTLAAPDRVAWWRQGRWHGPGYDGTVLAVDGGWALDAMGALHHEDGRQSAPPVERAAALLDRPEGPCVGGAGAACLSGERWLPLPSPPGQVRAMAQLQGALWVGTDEGRVCRLDGQRGWACEHTVKGAVRAMAVEGETLLVGHARGLSWIGPAGTRALEGPDVRALSLWDGEVYASTSRGLQRPTPEGWAPIGEDLSPSPGLVADGDGLLLVRGGRLLRLREPQSGPARSLPALPPRCATGPGAPLLLLLLLLPLLVCRGGRRGTAWSDGR